MAVIKTLAEAEELLAGHVPVVKAITGKQMTLERMGPLMRALGNPHERLRIIHVAGTSGKTSTSYYIAGLLTAAGKKVGLTVSPHIDSMTERVQINMKPLAEPEFVPAFNEFYEIVSAADFHPSYFELLVSFAYWYFEKVKVDYAVVETGLGGMYDGTNIAQGLDKLCVITDIGLDHMHILGDTVRKIAEQKAGIIHQGNTVFVQQQSDDIISIIKDRCDVKGAQLHVVGGVEQELPSSLPDFQKRNAALAYYVYRYMLERDVLNVVAVDYLANVRVPGRMNDVVANNKIIVMDGAHNEQKMEAFVTSFQTRYSDAKVPILFSLKQGKEAISVLPLLKRIASHLVITEYDWVQDLPIPSLDAHELRVIAEKFGYEHIAVEKDKDAAYRHFLNLIEDIGIITGSFYLISQLRQEYSELKT